MKRSVVHIYITSPTAPYQMKCKVLISSIRYWRREPHTARDRVVKIAKLEVKFMCKECFKKK